jgi:hypothetical protein
MQITAINQRKAAGQGDQIATSPKTMAIGTLKTARLSPAACHRPAKPPTKAAASRIATQITVHCAALTIP